MRLGISTGNLSLEQLLKRLLGLVEQANSQSKVGPFFGHIKTNTGYTRAGLFIDFHPNTQTADAAVSLKIRADNGQCFEWYSTSPQTLATMAESLKQNAAKLLLEAIKQAAL